MDAVPSTSGLQIVSPNHVLLSSICNDGKTPHMTKYRQIESDHLSNWYNQIVHQLWSDGQTC